MIHVFLLCFNNGKFKLLHLKLILSLVLWSFLEIRSITINVGTTFYVLWEAFALCISTV